MFSILHHRRNPRLLISRGVTPRARPPPMLFRILVINKRLAMLIISSWLIARDFYDGEIAVALAEDGVHFFQGAVGGFGVEEVYDWDHEGVAVEWSED